MKILFVILGKMIFFILGANTFQKVYFKEMTFVDYKNSLLSGDRVEFTNNGKLCEGFLERKGKINGIVVVEDGCSNYKINVPWQNLWETRLKNYTYNAPSPSSERIGTFKRPMRSSLTDTFQSLTITSTTTSTTTQSITSTTSIPRGSVSEPIFSMKQALIPLREFQIVKFDGLYGMLVDESFIQKGYFNDIAVVLTTAGNVSVDMGRIAPIEDYDAPPVSKEEILAKIPKLGERIVFKRNGDVHTGIFTRYTPLGAIIVEGRRYNLVSYSSMLLYEKWMNGLSASELSKSIHF